MFRRFMEKITSKSTGAASTDEYFKHNLSLFLNRNGIIKPDLIEYRVDRSQHSPHKFKVVLVGKAMKNQRLVGVLVYYDEAIGTIIGKLIPPENTIKHGIIAKAYKDGIYHYRSLYNAFLFEMDGYDMNKMEPKQELS